MGGYQEQSGRAIHPPKAVFAKLRARKFRRQVRLGGYFHPLSRNIEQRHRPERHSPGAEAIRIRFPALSQGRDDSGSSDDDAG
jgi:hypothetical protein